MKRIEGCMENVSYLKKGGNMCFQKHVYMCRGSKTCSHTPSSNQAKHLHLGSLWFSFLLYLLFSFQDLVLYFGLKPKMGENEVTTGHLFMLWFEFCADFKARWKRENKNISKERYQIALFVLHFNLEKWIPFKKLLSEKAFEWCKTCTDWSSWLLCNRTHPRSPVRNVM